MNAEERMEEFFQWVAGRVTPEQIAEAVSVAVRKALVREIAGTVLLETNHGPARDA